MIWNQLTLSRTSKPNHCQEGGGLNAVARGAVHLCPALMKSLIVDFSNE
jgi:hypothetical protein